MRLLICAPDIFDGDAVGNHCLGLAETAARAGWNPRTYAQCFDAATPHVHPIESLFDDVTSDDLLFVSYSIFDPYLERLLALPCRKICYFHGVTDPALLREFEPVTAGYCEQALAQLPQLAKFDTVVANSAYVARGLADHVDVSDIVVIPPVFTNLPTFRYNRAVLHPHTGFNMLVLGRVVPHKRVEDAIEVLARVVADGVDATMTIVGSMPNYEYSKLLLKRAHARRLGPCRFHGHGRRRRSAFQLRPCVAPAVDEPARRVLHPRARGYVPRHTSSGAGRTRRGRSGR